MLRPHVVLASLILAACGSEAPTSPELTALGMQDKSARLPARTILGTLGGPSSFAFDINDKGVIVGRAQTASGQNHAFRWTTEAGMIDLGTLPGDQSSEATGVADDGTIVGLSTSATGIVRVVRWPLAGQISEIPLPTSVGVIGQLSPDINSRGEVAGTRVYDDPFITTHAWVWTPRTGFNEFGAQLAIPGENYASRINNKGQIVGSLGGGVFQAYVWDARTGARLLGGLSAEPGRENVIGAGINAHGRITGSARLEVDTETLDGRLIPPYTDFNAFGIVWDPRQGFRLLPRPEDEGGGLAGGQDINDHGLVVGSALVSAADGIIVAVAWPSTGGIVYLNGSELNTSVTTSVNNKGLAVGATGSNGDIGPLVAAVWNTNLAPSAGPSLALTARAQGPVKSAWSGRLSRCVGALSSTRGALADCLQRAE